MQKFIVSPKYKNFQKNFKQMVENFDSYSDILGNPERNVIKKIPFQEGYIAIKSFKKPHWVNKIAYKYLRKSKARRSYEHGLQLLQLGILNPEPMAYIENSDFFGITSSYYICQYTPYDFTIREIYDQPDAFLAVQAYARFSAYVHSKGVYIKDNTPGNTLVQRNNQEYNMYLVDLNRMEFHENLSFEVKMKSLSNNIKEQPFLDIFMEEYSKVSGYPLSEVRERMFHYQQIFNRKIESKARLKKRLKKLMGKKI